MNKRKTYLDVSKAYLIILVVIGHVLIVLNPTYDKLLFSLAQEFIYSFHMSAFFIIHGILFNKEKYKSVPFSTFIESRIKSLIIPFLFFESIGIVWKNIFSNQSIITGVLNLISIRCNVGADWFLPALFIGSFCFFIYTKYENKTMGILTVLLSIVFVMFFPQNQLSIVLGRGLLGYCFIFIGNELKDYFIKKRYSISLLFMCFFILCICAIVNLKFGGNDFYSCRVSNPINLIIAGICGTFGIIQLSKMFNFKTIQWIGNHTLTIMGTHQLIIYATVALFPNTRGGNIFVGLLMLICISIFEIAIVYLIDNYLPYLVGRKS